MLNLEWLVTLLVGLKRRDGNYCFVTMFVDRIAVGELTEIYWKLMELDARVVLDGIAVEELIGIDWKLIKLVAQIDGIAAEESIGKEMVARIVDSGIAVFKSFGLD